MILQPTVVYKYKPYIRTSHLSTTLIAFATSSKGHLIGHTAGFGLDGRKSLNTLQYLHQLCPSSPHLFASHSIALTISPRVPLLAFHTHFLGDFFVLWAHVLRGTNGGQRRGSALLDTKMGRVFQCCFGILLVRGVCSDSADGTRVQFAYCKKSFYERGPHIH